MNKIIYNIPEDLFNGVLDVLTDNMFITENDGEYSEEFNNDEVISVLKKLEKIKEEQDKNL